jgi:hypothetical protein
LHALRVGARGTADGAVEELEGDILVGLEEDVFGDDGGLGGWGGELEL